MKKIILLLFLIPLLIANDDYHQKGIDFREQQDFGQALYWLEKAAADNPRANYLFDLAYTYGMIGKVDQAVSIYHKIIKQWPHTQEQLLYNIAYCYKMAGNIEAALEYYKKSLALRPDHRHTHFGISLAYLAIGEYEKAWHHYAFHLQGLNRNAEKLRELIKNNDLYGKRILLKAEGGLGDTINFIRWAIWFKKYGAKVIASVQEPLLPLLKNCYFIDQLVNWKQPPPAHDAEVTLISVNCICQASEKTIPHLFPYIFPESKLNYYWFNKLQKDSNLKIGLCWEGSVFNDQSRLPVARRGISLQKLLPLFSIPNTTFYSLQKCDGLTELESLPLPENFIVFENLDEKYPFADSAAIINNVDLVICIDSAIAHLAGALGKKVWLLLPYQSDWRWLANRTDSIWYPSMTLFKQPTPFDWDLVVEQLHLKLLELSQSIF